MLVRIPPEAGEAILGAMRAIALEHGDDGVTAMDRETIVSAGAIVLGLNGFDPDAVEFPGNPGGLAEGFTTPHDSSHVLSGYSTSEMGELCVSTFIGAMHPDHPMAAEVLPVIYSWHIGVKLNEIANSSHGAFEPRHFWTAWERGAATTVDVVATDWDFWGAAEVPLEELQAEYGVPPTEPELLA